MFVLSTYPIDMNQKSLHTSVYQLLGLCNRHITNLGALGPSVGTITVAQF